ncbi:unnamed protein product [Phaedon cochleariae]|uniref:Ima1 N-terminal domain-containing protein n=1 Tax=Phaedon cochleariae TaxID=80249 RepID=A0A9P0DR92_PHACE|nr:unnamed protein product [Phaedon cochleariae]
MDDSMMNHAMEGLSLLVSSLALCLLIFVVILNLYFIKQNGFHVSVNCWFCNAWTKVLYSNRNSFECPTCQQYNGFDKDGGYNRVIEAQHSLSKLTSMTIKKNEPYTNGLCNYCNNNQQLKVYQLANFTPINDNNYDMEVEHFQEQLEKSYKLCKKCEKVVKTSIDNKNAWIFGNNLKNLKNKGISLIDLTKSNGLTRELKQSFCLKIIRYTLIVFTVLILCQILNVKIDFPIPNIKIMVPKILGSYKIILTEVWFNATKQFEEKMNNLNSFMPVDIRNKLVPITSIGCLLNFVLLICDKKSVWWKINDSLGWLVLVLSSTMPLDSDSSVFINILQVLSSLSLFYSYISHEPQKKVKKSRKKCQFVKVKKSIEDSSEEEIEDVQNSLSCLDSCKSTYQDFNTSHCQSYPAMSPFRCYQNDVGHNQSFSTAKSNSTAPFFNSSHGISNNSLHSDLNISMDNLNLNSMNSMNLIPPPCSSPVFSVSSPRRPVLSPPRLKNITQNPWTAGGFWKNDSQVLSANVHPTNLSRSSSQSSGFVSSNFNSLPASREHSLGGDVERTSVLSEPAYHFLPINSNASQLTSEQLYYKTDNNTFYPVLGQNNMLFIQNGVPQQSSFGNQSLRSFSTGVGSPLLCPPDRPVSALFRNLQGKFSDSHSFRKPHSISG